MILKLLRGLLLASALASASPVLAGDQSPCAPMTLTTTTTAFAANQWIAPVVSATQPAGFIPFIVIPNVQGSGGNPFGGMRLYSNDATATAWANAVVQLDAWSAAPTLSISDRGAYLSSGVSAIATGSANYLGSWQCQMTQAGDGAYGRCAVTVANFGTVRLRPNDPVFWTAFMVSGGGTQGSAATKTLTACAEVVD